MIANGRCVVETVGKRQRIVETPDDPGTVALVDLEAASDNSGIICIGNSNVVAALTDYNSIELAAGDLLTLRNINLYDVWADVRTAGDAITWLVRDHG